MQFLLAVALALDVAAQRPAPLPMVPVTRLDDRSGAHQLDAPRAVSLTFARPLPVRDVVMLLFRSTPFSVVVDPVVSSTFVGELKDLTLRQALESVLSTAAADYNVEGTIVRVFPRKPEMRLFAVDYLQTSPGPADFFADAGAGVQSLLSASGRFNVNRKASLIQVTDFADRLDLVAAYLESAQLRANRQVRIDTRVLEVARPDGRPVDWSDLASRQGGGVQKIAGAPGWRVDDLEALFSALGGAATVRQIAAPTMLAMNNEQSVLSAEGAQSELRLSVTPQISANGIIHMQISPSYVTGHGSSGQFRTSMDSIVRVANGETVIVAGLMRQREDGGFAELVILLTPVRVGPATLAAAGGR